MDVAPGAVFGVGLVLGLHDLGDLFQAPIPRSLFPVLLSAPPAKTASGSGINSQVLCCWDGKSTSGQGGDLEHFYVFSFFSPPDFFPPHSEPSSASPGDNAMTAALKRAGGVGFVQEGEKNWDEGGREGGREGLRRRGDATLLLALAVIIPSRLLGAGAASPFPGRWDPCPPPLLLAFPAFIFMDFLYFIFMFPP